MTRHCLPAGRRTRAGPGTPGPQPSSSWHYMMRRRIVLIATNRHGLIQMKRGGRARLPITRTPLQRYHRCSPENYYECPRFLPVFECPRFPPFSIPKAPGPKARLSAAGCCLGLWISYFVHPTQIIFANRLTRGWPPVIIAVSRGLLRVRKYLNKSTFDNLFRREVPL